MFYYFYPMNGMYAYEYGTAMSRMLMDMREAAERHYQKNRQDVPYYVVLNGASAGPYSFDEIRELIRDGKVTRESYIWKPQMQNWEFAANIAELQPLVNFTPPPVPEIKQDEDEAHDTRE
ncbi:protein of unknown function [Ruminococcaceae bacterium P7]|nr:protein of unknown function [Ruminococcaceae bacterium P7]